MYVHLIELVRATPPVMVTGSIFLHVASSERNNLNTRILAGWNCSESHMSESSHRGVRQNATQGAACSAITSQVRKLQKMFWILDNVSRG